MLPLLVSRLVPQLYLIIPLYFKIYNLYVYFWIRYVFIIQKQAIIDKFMGGIAVPNHWNRSSAQTQLGFFAVSYCKFERDQILFIWTRFEHAGKQGLTIQAPLN